MLRFQIPRVAASETVQLNNQQTENDQQQYSTLEKHLHTEHFMVRAAAAPAAEMLEPLILGHYQVG